MANQTDADRLVLANVFSELSKAGTVPNQVNRLREFRGVIEKENDLSLALDAAILIGEMGLEDIYNEKFIGSAIGSANSRLIENLFLGDVDGFLIGALGSGPFSVLGPGTISGALGLGQISGMQASMAVFARYQQAGAFGYKRPKIYIDVIHGPNDPNGPIKTWPHTPGPGELPDGAPSGPNS